ncbi:hypothetical protein [Hymenobacter terrenus]|nr:hypothetical protein [Hymenobacter terrenus]
MSTTPSPVHFANPAGQLREDPAGFIRIEWSNQPRGLHDAQDL